MIIFFAQTATSTNIGDILQWAIPAAIGVISGVITFFVVLKVTEEKVNNLVKTVDELKKSKESMKTDVDQLLEFKTQAQKFIDKNIYKDQSPLSLTDLGQKLVDDSGFTEIFKSVKDDLVEMLEVERPNNQYDVQEKARALMDNLAGYPKFKPIKQYAFDHGKDFNQILRAGAIMLRDYYFEKHPEIVNNKEQW